MYLYFLSDPPRNIAIDMHEIQIVLIRLLLSNFISSFTVIKMFLRLRKLALLLCTDIHFKCRFHLKGQFPNVMLLSFCLHSCTCTAT
jgi:hypothetical protein